MRPDPGNIPANVAALTSCFLEAVDSEVPSFVQGLYLTGSVALGDFTAHDSDVDFVAVSEHRPSKAELIGLEAAHRRLRDAHPAPAFDGTHVTWSDLTSGPDACAPAPFAYAGRFEPSGRFALDPVTWHELVSHGLAIRGPSMAGAAIGSDAVALRTWTSNNLVDYWTPWVSRYRDNSDVDQQRELVCWGVLGIARLHYTLTTGRITSKTRAGQYALSAFDSRWAQIIEEAIRMRADPKALSAYADPLARRRDVVDFMSVAIGSMLQESASPRGVSADLRRF